MSKVAHWAVICGSYINAYSIITSLRASGWSDPIVCIKDQKSSRVFAETLGDGVQVWTIDLSEPMDLLVALAQRIPAEDQKVVFFTDERFHIAFRDHGKNLIPNCRFMIGSATRLDIVLDRFEFCQFIETNRLAGVPRTIASNCDPFERLGDSFFIRPNLTWQGLHKLPRVQLVHDQEQKRQAEKHLISAGLAPDQWCYQEALSLDPRHNVSVCGWHDDQRPLYFATHHLLRHPNEAGNGDVTEWVEPPFGLFAVATRVLNGLQYEGPFELEFVLDQKSREYKVIELNPRFWMQHGLLEALTGHKLVKRYVGLADNTELDSNPEIRYWVNTFYAIFRLIKGDWRVLRYLVGNHTLLAPNWSLTMKFSSSLANQKLRKAFSI